MVESFETIRPFDRVLVRKSHEPVGYFSTRDGSDAGYSMVGYLLTKDPNEDVRSDILTAKCKVSKWTTVTNELLSLVLSLGYSYATLKLLPGSVTMVLKTPIFAGDSTLVSTFFNPRLCLTNVLVRNAIYHAKSLARNILDLCPQGTLYITWLEEAKNSADLNSKFSSKPYSRY